jgi:hypothetical protein
VIIEARIPKALGTKLTAVRVMMPSSLRIVAISSLRSLRLNAFSSWTFVPFVVSDY